ncbi:MAG: PDZ domain-containing protein [Gaiellales bacterium]
MKRRVPFGTLALTGAGLLAALALYAAVTPSGDFLYLPNKATPVASHVKVEGKPEADDRGGIYYVDVTVRDARWIERLFPFLRPEGATIVAHEAIAPHGESFEERRAASRDQMARSEEIAAAVALTAAGLDVEIDDRGVLVSQVAIDVPAAKALHDGDIILKAGGKTTRTPLELRTIVGALAPGDSVELELRRGSRTLTETVKTIRSPSDGRTIIGITVEQDARITLPLKVDIDLGDVGGPSAGLPFALEVLQEYGRDVDRGHKIAATGEILLDGSVGPVGGLKQKTIGVRRSGAEIFLVPAGENAAEARRYAGSLRIVPVESFQQALRFLRTLAKKT